MSFVKSILYGTKLYFLFNLAIGIAIFIEIQRNDLSGKTMESFTYIAYSIDILTIVFPIFCFYVGSKQSNIIKRKTDSGFAAAISSALGFLMLLYLNWAIILGGLTVAGTINDPIFNDLKDRTYFNDLIFRLIPAIFAGIFSATINHNVNKKNVTAQKIEKEIPDTPWIYSVGTIDEHGFEWIKHNNIQWYRAANSGEEWKKYS